MESEHVDPRHGNEDGDADLLRCVKTDAVGGRSGLLGFGVSGTHTMFPCVITSPVRGHFTCTGRLTSLHHAGRIHAFPLVEMSTVKGWRSMMRCGATS